LAGLSSSALSLAPWVTIFVHLRHGVALGGLTQVIGAQDRDSGPGMGPGEALRGEVASWRPGGCWEVAMEGDFGDGRW
jgi:hypothetical protein